VSGSPTPRPTASTPYWLEVANPPSGAGIGTVFTVKIVEHSTVAVSGAQVTLDFDKNLLQIKSVSLGAPYAGAPFYLGASAAQITSANTTGSLKTVAADFLSPTSVAAGAQLFLVVNFQAVACGHSDLTIPVSGFDAYLVDGRSATYGAHLDTSAVGNSVSIGCSAGPSFLATPSPTPSPTPTHAPTHTPTPRSATGGGTQPQTVSTTPVPTEMVAADTSAVDQPTAVDATAAAHSPSTQTPTQAPKRDSGNGPLFTILAAGTLAAWVGGLVVLGHYGLALFRL
jgi:hypothetical protein